MRITKALFEGLTGMKVSELLGRLPGLAGPSPNGGAEVVPAGRDEPAA